MVWKFNGATWGQLGSGGTPVADGATRMMVSFPYNLGTKADSDGQYAVTGVEVTLPVELSSFTAVINSHNNVSLQWVTQSETNVSGFRIYRSLSDILDTADMLSAFIPATNTSQMQVYVYNDTETLDDGTYYYWLENLDMDGSNSFHGPISVNVTLGSPGTPNIPVLQGINNAYPNPFNPSVSISCGTLKAGHTTVDVYNQRGQKVRSLFNGTKNSGNFSLVWNGKDDTGRQLPSGVYLIHMNAAGEKSVRKVVMSK